MVGSTPTTTTSGATSNSRPDAMRTPRSICSNTSIDLDEIKAKLSAARRAGYHAPAAITSPTKYASIIHYGWYMGGTGWQEYRDARLISTGPGSWGILEKGRVNHARMLTGHVLVKGAPGRSSAGRARRRSAPGSHAAKLRRSRGIR